MNWILIGLGTKLVDDVSYPSYTFGTSYNILNNLSTVVEYVMTPSSEANIDDHIRLAVMVTF